MCFRGADSGTERVGIHATHTCTRAYIDTHTHAHRKRKYIPNKCSFFCPAKKIVVLLYMYDTSCMQDDGHTYPVSQNAPKRLTPHVPSPTHMYRYIAAYMRLLKPACISVHVFMLPLRLLQPLVATACCERLLQPPVANACCERLLQPLVATACCNRLLRTLVATACCERLLQPLVANACCNRLLQPLVANACCNRLLRTLVAPKIRGSRRGHEAARIAATCEINGNFQRFSTADLYHFTTGPPSERFSFTLQVAERRQECMHALRERIVASVLMLRPLVAPSSREVEQASVRA
jgi:hypothetical protein